MPHAACHAEVWFASISIERPAPPPPTPMLFRQSEAQNRVSSSAADRGLIDAIAEDEQSVLLAWTVNVT